MAREMKHSGYSYFGEIPSHWKMMRNGYLFECSKQIVSPTKDYQLLSLTTNGVKEKDINDVGGKVPENYDSYQVVQPEDLIMCLFDIDCSAVFSGLSKYHGMISPAYKILKSKSVILPDFAQYIFKYIGGKRLYKQYSKNVRYSLSIDDFNALKIPLPPLSEQEEITDFLNIKCTEIDGLLEDLEKEVKTLTEYKKSMIAETITRGLNHSVPMKQSGIPWVQEIPEHWKVMANKYLMYKVKEIVPIYGGQDIISLSMNGVIVRDLDAGGKMPTSFNGYQHITVGNLLMCLFDIDVTPRCIGLIKNDGLTSPAYSQFAMKAEAYAPYYYYFYLKMDNTKELVHLSKNMRHSLNEEQFGMIPTIVPPMDEQIAISKYLDEKIANIDKAISDKLLQIDKLKEYKASLIYEYVTGKKQVI